VSRKRVDTEASKAVRQRGYYFFRCACTRANRELQVKSCHASERNRPQTCPVFCSSTVTHHGFCSKRGCSANTKTRRRKIQPALWFVTMSFEEHKKTFVHRPYTWKQKLCFRVVHELVLAPSATRHKPLISARDTPSCPSTCPHLSASSAEARFTTRQCAEGKAEAGVLPAS